MSTKINWAKIFCFFVYSSILAFLALGLPQKICLLNGLSIDCGYGAWASYVVVILLFSVFFGDLKSFFIKKEGVKKK